MKTMWVRMSLVLALSALCLLPTLRPLAAGKVTLTLQTRENYWPDLARKYLDADLAIIAEVISFMPATLSKSDSLGEDGWTHHRRRDVIACRAIVDSVLKGVYGDSLVEFQSVPFVQRSRSRLVDPTDSMYVMEMGGPVNGYGEVPGLIHKVGCYLLLLQEKEDLYVCTYDGKPDELALMAFAEAEAKGEDYFESTPPTPAERYQAQQDTPRPEFVLRELTQAYNGRSIHAIDSLLTGGFIFVPAHGEAGKEGTADYWDRTEFISFNEILFDPEFISESGFYGAEIIYAKFILISKRPIDVPDSNHWELTCEVSWLIFNSQPKPKPFGAVYRGIACLTVKPDPLNEGSWLIHRWREESAEVRQLYR